MALYSIAVRSATNENEAIKAIRSFGSAPIDNIRALIGTEHPAITVDTSAFGIELEPIEGHKQQHAVIRAAIEQLKLAGCDIALSYQVAPNDVEELMSEEQLENFFAAELTYVEQEHD